MKNKKMSSKIKRYKRIDRRGLTFDDRKVSGRGKFHKIKRKWKKIKPRYHCSKCRKKVNILTMISGKGYCSKCI